MVFLAVVVASLVRLLSAARRYISARYNERTSKLRPPPADNGFGTRPRKGLPVKRGTALFVAFCCCTLLSAEVAFGQDTPATAALPAPATTQPQAATQPQTTASQTAGPRVTEVLTLPPGESEGAGLGDEIMVEVEGYDALLAAAGGACESVVLYLDGLPFPGIDPGSCDPQEGRLRFQLRRTDESDERWHSLLGEPQSFTRKITVSVGPTDRISIPTDVRDFPLIVMRRNEFYVVFGVLLVLWVAGFWLARRTDILRDSQAEVGPGERRPYSLARFQMAFWFLLVISAYYFLSVIIEELDSITPSILALMGIGSGTALGSSLIDSDKEQQAEVSTSRLNAEKQALAPTVDGLRAQAAITPDATARSTVDTQVAAKQARIAEIDTLLEQKQGLMKGASTDSFLRDVLETSAGISLHRFQMLIWTLVLGLIFVATVYRTLSMPDFSSTLLGLMGISSGTYLGFKFPERHDPEGPPPAVNPTGG